MYVKEYLCFRRHVRLFNDSNIGQVHQTERVKSLNSDSKMPSEHIGHTWPPVMGQKQSFV